MSLNVNVGGNASGFQQALNQAKQHAAKFSQEVTRDVGGSWANIGKSFVGGITGMIGLEGVKGFIAGLIDTAKSVRETAEAYDMSTDSVQKWGKGMDKAGLDMQVFLRTMDTLREKRRELLDDPTKGIAFRDAGLLDEAKNAAVSDEELLRKINALPRAQRMELLGIRGARVAAAQGYADRETANFSPAALETEKDGEMMLKQFKDEQQHTGVLFLTMLHDLFNPDFWTKGTVTGGPIGTPAEQKAKQDAADKEASDARVELAKADKRIADRLEEHKLLTENEAQAKEAAAGALALRNAERGNMTIGARRESLRAELKLAEDKERATRDLLAKGGLTDAEKADQLFTDADRRKLVNERTLSLTTDRTRQASLLGELREHPFDVHADSLAKIGLYSSASLNGGGAGSVPQQQLTELKQIRLAVQRKSRDPHAP